MNRKIDWLVVHRIAVSHVGYPDTAEGVAAFHREHREGVGHMPYHEVIEPDGRWRSMVEHRVVTSHAVRLNPVSIALAVVGDFRREPPAVVQLIAAAGALGVLLKCYPGARIVGHTEQPGCTRITWHDCPGRLFPTREVELMARTLVARWG